MFKLIQGLIAICILIVSTVHAAPININTASVEEIAEALYGVGPNKARAIVDYRDQKGRFKSVEELARIKGIGKVIIAGNQGDIIID
jgi:competence protein ComEA